MLRDCLGDAFALVCTIHAPGGDEGRDLSVPRYRLICHSLALLSPAPSQDVPGLLSLSPPPLSLVQDGHTNFSF